VRSVLEVNLDALAGDPGAELGRILRFWGGATKQLDLSKPQSQDLYDPSYAKPVGRWVIEEGNDTPAGGRDAITDTDRHDAE